MVKNKILICLLPVFYLMSVVGCSSGGSEGTTNNLPQGDNPVLVAPANVTVLPGDGMITITWSPVDNAIGYNLYLATESGITLNNILSLSGAQIYSSVTSPLNITGLVNGTSYYLRLSAFNANEELLSSEIISTPVSSFVIPPALPSVRAKHASSVLDNKLFIIGGSGGGSNSYINSVQIYNPVTNLWANGLSLTLGRKDFSACTVGDAIYAVGGLASNGTYVTGVTDDTLAYNGTTLFWTSVQNYPVTVKNNRCVTYNNEMIVFHGNAINKYNPASNTWSALSLPNTNFGALFCAVQVSDKIYVFGGNVNSNGTYIYNLSNDTWDTGTDIPIGRSSHACIAYGNKAYLFGGASVTGGGVSYFPVAIDVYDTTSNTWSTSAATLSTGRADLSANIIGTDVYVVGGNNGSVVNTVDKFSVSDL